MISQATVIYGAGDQEVEGYALDNSFRTVRPTSATGAIVDLCRYEDDPDRVVLAEGAAIVDPASATTTSDAGLHAADQRRLDLDAIPAGLVIGRLYRVTDGTNADAFTLDRVDVAGLAVYARDPFRADYAPGSTFEGLRVSAVFPAAVADDEDQLRATRPFAVDWTFEGVDGPGRARTIVTIQRLARAGWATVADVTRIDPQIVTIHGDRVNIESSIEQAEIELGARLEQRGFPPESLVAQPHAGLAVAYRAIELIYRVLGDLHIGRAEWAREQALDFQRMVVDSQPPISTQQLSRRTDRSVEPTRKSAWRPA